MAPEKEKKHDAAQKTEEKEKSTNDQENSDDESVLASNKTGQDNNNSTPKDNEVQLENKPIYMDLHLNIPETKENTGPMAAIETLSKTLHNWLQGIQEMDDSFKLHSVDPSYTSQKVLHNLDNFPTTNMNEIKEFFKGARPIIRGGKTFMKIKASFKSAVQELVGNAHWYHSEKKELFRKSAIQACHIDIIRWLLYSTRSTDKERLQDVLSNIVEHDISIRWMRINDGSGWQKDQDTSNDPRALHIECAASISRQVEIKIRKIYSSNQTTFPLHTRLRFVPAFTKLLDLDSIAKFRLLANRQDGWSKQHVARSRDDIIKIDRTCKNLDKTLRDLIMGIKAKDRAHPLFAYVDRKWNCQGYNFSFHKKSNRSKYDIERIISEVSS